MAITLAAAQAEVAKLTEKVTAATTLDASVAILVQDQVVKLADLAREIADLKAGTITQTDIDALATSIADQATALSLGTVALQGAVPANVKT